MNQHAILLQFNLGDGNFGKPGEIAHIQQGEEEIRRMLEKSKVGELDGHEYGGGQYTIYIYGTEADSMFSELFPFLASWDCLQGGYAIKRYGPPGAKADRIAFGEMTKAN
jgi:hypothetical protein